MVRFSISWAAALCSVLLAACCTAGLTAKWQTYSSSSQWQHCQEAAHQDPMTACISILPHASHLELWEQLKGEHCHRHSACPNPPHAPRRVYEDSHKA